MNSINSPDPLSNLKINLVDSADPEELDRKLTNPISTQTALIPEPMVPVILAKTWMLQLARVIMESNARNKLKNLGFLIRILYLFWNILGITLSLCLTLGIMVKYQFIKWELSRYNLARRGML